MKNKIWIALLVVLILPIVLAEPVIVRAPVTITIENSSLKIKGSGVNYEQSFTVNLVTNTTTNTTTYSIHFIDDEEFIFVQDFDCGNLSMARLIDKLDVCGSAINFSQQWKDCITLNGELDTKLMVCEEDRGYKGNYSFCVAEKKSLEDSVNNKNSEISILKTEKKDTEKNKYFWLVGGLIVGGIVYHFYLQQKGKTQPQYRDEIEGRYPPVDKA